MHDILFQNPQFNPICTASSSGKISKRSDPVSNIARGGDVSASKRAPDAGGCTTPEDPKKLKKLNFTKQEIEERKQTRHEERMAQKEKMFNWFVNKYSEDNQK